MASKNTIETILGAVVLFIAAIFMSFAYNVADIGSSTGYLVKAQFERVDGLSQGTDVRMSGIKVGSVTGQHLNPDTYMAEVELMINNGVKLPVDTVAEISTEGLLGGKYLSLIPGSEEEFIETGGSIEYTQAPLDLVQLLGKFVFSSSDKKEGEAAAATPAPAPAPAAAAKPVAAKPVVAKPRVEPPKPAAVEVPEVSEETTPEEAPAAVPVTPVEAAPVTP